ncbi:hypothetical protein [Actinomycetospora sp. NBRC 106375]|uniref:hypothetical protein n=1 Tax=Actinomycetospora sp. NBRC 106375 TaxID=3032207 RepID=UPI002555BB5A|nr:hypothetical protein [Actinomycetospora sp. NBRC 106375]
MLISEEHIAAAYAQWSNRNRRTWGMLDGEWLDAVRHVASELEDVAERGSTVTYGELCVGTSFARAEHWHHVVADVLMVVGIACDFAQLPMLTALAVNKDHGTPGGGFYDAARHLGRLTTRGRDESFWISEIKKVHRQWAAAGAR